MLTGLCCRTGIVLAFLVLWPFIVACLWFAFWTVGHCIIGLYHMDIFVYFTVSLSYQVVPCLLYCALAVVRSFVVIIHPLILRGHHSCQAVWNVLSDSPIVELPLRCPLDAP